MGMGCTAVDAPGKYPPSPLILQLKYSSGIPVQITPVWQVMVLHFVKLATSPTPLKITMRKLIAL